MAVIGCSGRLLQHALRRPAGGIVAAHAALLRFPQVPTLADQRRYWARDPREYEVRPLREARHSKAVFMPDGCRQPSPLVTGCALLKWLCPSALLAPPQYVSAQDIADDFYTATEAGQAIMRDLEVGSGVLAWGGLPRSSFRLGDAHATQQPRAGGHACCAPGCPCSCACALDCALPSRAADPGSPPARAASPPAGGAAGPPAAPRASAPCTPALPCRPLSCLQHRPTERPLNQAPVAHTRELQLALTRLRLPPALPSAGSL